jgi:hypothetical protein
MVVFSEILSRFVHQLGPYVAEVFVIMGPVATALSGLAAVASLRVTASLERGAGVTPRVAAGSR